MREAKKTLVRVIGLIWILAAVVTVVGFAVYMFHPFSLLPYILGELLGSAVSSALMWHRYTTLDVELDLEQKQASGHMRLMASVRSLVLLAALLLAFWMPQFFYPVTVFAGLFATKAAALLYPAVYRGK